MYNGLIILGSKKVILENGHFVENGRTSKFCSLAFVPSGHMATKHWCVAALKNG